MDREEMTQQVKENLRLDTEDHDLRILDVIQAVCDYCNLSPLCIPGTLESFVRQKVQRILDYEKSNGPGCRPAVASISEGDVTVSFAQSLENSWAAVSELNARDKQCLNRYRKLR